MKKKQSLQEMVRKIDKMNSPAAMHKFLCHPNGRGHCEGGCRSPIDLERMQALMTLEREKQKERDERQLPRGKKENDRDKWTAKSNPRA